MTMYGSAKCVLTAVVLLLAWAAQDPQPLAGASQDPGVLKAEVQALRLALEAESRLREVLVQELNVGTVPLWVPLPYLGDELPSNSYVWCDGKTVFPDEPRVPAHLRRQLVPDMSGQKLLSGPISRVGARESVKELGKPVDKTKAKVASGQFSVSASLDLNPAGSMRHWMHHSYETYKRIQAAIPAEGRHDAYIPMLDATRLVPKPLRKGGKPGEKIQVARDAGDWRDQIFCGDSVPFDLVHRFPLSKVASIEAKASGSIAGTVDPQTVDIQPSDLPGIIPVNYIVRIR